MLSVTVALGGTGWELMNEREKSLALANLMGWKIKKSSCGVLLVNWEDSIFGRSNPDILCPYAANVIGRVQFAVILLKFPNVITEFVCTELHTHRNATSPERYEKYGGMFQGFIVAEKPFTQKSVLDEILRLNGCMKGDL